MKHMAFKTKAEKNEASRKVPLAPLTNELTNELTN